VFPVGFGVPLPISDGLLDELISVPEGLVNRRPRREGLEPFGLLISVWLSLLISVEGVPGTASLLLGLLLRLEPVPLIPGVAPLVPRVPLSEGAPVPVPVIPVLEFDPTAPDPAAPAPTPAEPAAPPPAAPLAARLILGKDKGKIVNMDKTVL
jgi:hypothetical protein